MILLIATVTSNFEPWMLRKKIWYSCLINKFFFVPVPNMHWLKTVMFVGLCDYFLVLNQPCAFICI